MNTSKGRDPNNSYIYGGPVLVSKLDRPSALFSFSGDQTV
jgi:hypothetical protein